MNYTWRHPGGRGLLSLACATAALFAPASTRAAEMPHASDAFVDSMGTNVHTAFGGPYYDTQGLVDALKYIGFRNVRDVPSAPDRLNALTTGAGVKVCVISQYFWYGIDAFDPRNFDPFWAQVTPLKNVLYLESPNEPQNLPDYGDKLAAWTARLHEAAKADPKFAATPILAPSLYGPAADVTALNAYYDYGNIHYYPQPADTSRIPSFHIAVARTVTGDKPIVATESGYHNAYLVSTGVSETAAAKYLPRLFLDNFNAGLLKTFNYELVDSFDDGPGNAEAHFGLLRTDFTYKPAAVALKNLIALLKDPGAEFVPAPLDLTLSVTGGQADVRHTLLQKRDGTYWLALWQNATSYDQGTNKDLAVDPATVSLEFGGVPVVRAATYRPEASTNPTGSFAADTRVTVAVDDAVTLVALRLAGPGDANADGVVDTDDFARLYRNLDAGTTWAQGDFNRDGRVDFHDFQILEVHFGQGVTPAQVEQMEAAVRAAQTPEPGAALTLGAIGGWTFSRRRRPRHTA